MVMMARPKRASVWANALLMTAAILIGIAGAEAAVRIINGQPLVAFPCPAPSAGTR